MICAQRARMGRVNGARNPNSKRHGVFLQEGPLQAFRVQQSPDVSRRREKDYLELCERNWKEESVEDGGKRPHGLLMGERPTHHPLARPVPCLGRSTASYFKSTIFQFVRRDVLCGALVCFVKVLGSVNICAVCFRIR